MHGIRRKVREWLIGSSRIDFKHIVEDAKITDEAMQILDLKFIHGMSNIQIADKCHCSLEKINYIIRQSYDKLAKLI